MKDLLKIENFKNANSIGVKLTWQELEDLLDQQRNEIIELINGYSSASSRAENDYERGISKGIELFREYLLKNLEPIKE